MTARKATVRKRAVKVSIPPTTIEFRAQVHAAIDVMLDHFPGTDSVAIIVDGASGHNVGSIPMSLSVKEGLFLAGYRKLFGDVEK